MKKIAYRIIICSILLVSVLGNVIQTSYTVIIPKPIEESALNVDSIIPKKPTRPSSNITEIDSLPGNSMELNLSEVFIDIEISGEIPNNTQVWVGCRNKSVNSVKDVDLTPNHEVQIENKVIRRRGNITSPSDFGASLDAYTLGFKKENMIPSRDNVWYLRIENPVNGTQLYFDWVMNHPNETDYY
ncbi:MAG: hypothetical protein ACFFCQ_10495 [Promethearchaeota archaeon]